MTSEFQNQVLKGFHAINNNVVALIEVTKELSGKLSQQQGNLQQWKQDNPQLSHDCQRAAEKLAQLQQEFVQELTDEALREGGALDGWACREFIDKYGQRLLQLNGMVAYLTQLGAS